MAVLPEIITVRRKRGADTAALDFLHLEPNKRYRSDNFVYQRRPAKSTVQTSKPGHNSWPAGHVDKKSSSSWRGQGDDSTGSRRKFYLKRDRRELEDDYDKSRGILFVERHCKRLRSADSDVPEIFREQQQDRRLKRPGHRAVSMQKLSIRPISAEAPSEEHIQMLQAWVMEESALTKPLFAPPPMEFKPKPIQRYAERHYSHASQEPSPATTESDSDDDGDDCITETYVRMPVHLAETSPGHAVGTLVLESNSDVEFFYGETDAESEGEFDDDDSNDENYYANDYPEEEGESWSDQGEPGGYFGDESGDDGDSRENVWSEMYFE